MGGRTDAEFDEDLCSGAPGTHAGRAVLLLDLTKPLDANARLTEEVLHEVTTAMEADTELQVFALAPDAFAPRVPLGRVCKPYSNAQLVVEMAKDRSSTKPDCADLPAQLAPTIRDRATRFCARREALARRIANVASVAGDAAVPAAYLIEAIEDTRLDLATASERRSLYVFSDMMQHAGWYSHVERGPDRWNYGDFQRLRHRQTGLVGASPPPDSNLDVTIFYVLRQGVTEHPRVGLALERFWRDYFSSVASVTFERQPVQVGYDVRPLGSSPDDDIDSRRGALLAETKPVVRNEDAPPAAPTRAPERPALETAVAGGLGVGPEGGNADKVTAIPPSRESGDGEVAEGVADGNAQRVEDRGTGVADADAPATIDVAAASGAGATHGATEPTGQDAGSGLPQEAVLTETPADPAAGPGFPIAPLPADAEPVVPTSVDLSASGPPVDVPPCSVRLRREFEVEDLYPSRPYSRRKANYGSAEIVVAYMIDDDGETVDDEVSFLPEQSTADVPRHMPLFSDTAEEAVRAWRFDFDGDQDGCEKRQRRTTRFSFRYAR